VGALVCSAPYSCDKASGAGFDWSVIVGFFVGASIGAIVAPILDAALLAYDPASPEQAALRATRLAFSLRPDLRFTREHTALVGLRGSF
ncbi:MAG TPA: hypothetical protein VNG33_01580, partial [Polyangiaceae bacterium]|nr:hypothetical protein [Polyangiaceae bacterium]